MGLQDAQPQTGSLALEESMLSPVHQCLLALARDSSTWPSLAVLNVPIKQPEPLQLPVPTPCTAKAGLSLCPQGDNKQICSTANRNNLTSISSAPNFFHPKAHMAQLLITLANAVCSNSVVNA